VNGFTHGPTPTPDEGPERRRWSRLAAGAAVLAPLALAGCNLYPSYGASRGVTTQGQATFKLYSGMMTTGIIIGGLVGLLILWTIVRYRRRSEEMPRQFHESIPVEILYTSIPVLIVAVLFVFTVIVENKVVATEPVHATQTAAGKPIERITVTAFQWGWRFDYPAEDVSVAGEVTNGPGGKGPQMVMPVDATVQVKLISNDVIHGFYVREFNFSRYALPGVVNYFDLNATKTGIFDGQCTQICGLYHSLMLFTVKVLPRDQFAQWTSAQHAAGHTIDAANGSGTGASNVQPPNARITPSQPTPAGAK